VRLLLLLQQPQRCTRGCSLVLRPSVASDSCNTQKALLHHQRAQAASEKAVPLQVEGKGTKI
jgi:hypothetical protein